MLNQTTRRQINKMFPKSYKGYRLYNDPDMTCFIYDPEAGSPLMLLRVGFLTKELMGEERLLDVALRHDLDLDFIKPAPSPFAEAFFEITGKEYEAPPFGFMTSLLDELLERGKKEWEQEQVLLAEKMRRYREARGIKDNELIDVEKIKKKNPPAEPTEQVPVFSQKKKGLFSRLFSKKKG